MAPQHDRPSAPGRRSPPVDGRSPRSRRSRSSRPPMRHRGSNCPAIASDAVALRRRLQKNSATKLSRPRLPPRPWRPRRNPGGRGCRAVTAARSAPFTIMAASLGVGAAAVGAMIGAVVASGIARPTPVASGAGPNICIEDVNALKEQVVQARVELAALEVEHRRRPSQRRTSSSPRITERVERMERTQAEPVLPSSARRSNCSREVCAAPKLMPLHAEYDADRLRSRRRSRSRARPANPANSVRWRAGCCATFIAAPPSSRAAWASSKSIRATWCRASAGSRRSASRTASGSWSPPRA